MKITHNYGAISSFAVNLSSDKKRLLFRLSQSAIQHRQVIEFETAVSEGARIADAILAVSQRASQRPVKRKGKPSLRVVPND